MSKQLLPLGRYVQLPVSAGMPEAWQGAWQQVGSGGDAKWLTLLEVRPCLPCQLHFAIYRHQADRLCRLVESGDGFLSCADEVSPSLC